MIFLPIWIYNLLIERQGLTMLSPAYFKKIKTCIMAVIACPCEYDGNFGSSEGCQPQTPGMQPTAVFVCLDKIQTLTRVQCDPSNPKSGVISDFKVQTGKNGVIFYSQDESVDAKSSQSVNNNGGKDLNETIAGKGFLDAASYCWMEQHLGKFGYMIQEDAEENLTAWLTKVESFEAVWGVKSGDFKGINYNLVNTKFPRVMEVDLSILGEYASNEDFFNYLIGQ